MSYIPDCRTDEAYNQKYLGLQDTNFLNGFDWAVETAVDNFFDNDMNELQNEGEYLGRILCEELPKYLQDEYTVAYTFGHENEDREVKTYADLIRMKLLEWIEMARNELIVSMLENMDDEEYERIKEQIDGRGKEKD